MDLEYGPADDEAQIYERQFCDGGVCANSPTIIAIAFALVSGHGGLQKTINAGLLAMVKLWGAISKLTAV